jgi:hypothetical protein
MDSRLLAAGVVVAAAGAAAVRDAVRGGSAARGSDVVPKSKVPGYTIKADGRWHELRYREDVPKQVLKDDFDWLDEDEGNGFFKFQNNWWHLSQIERLPPGPLQDAGWHGAMPWSWSNGILLTLAQDGERYQVGYFYLSESSP